MSERKAEGLPHSFGHDIFLAIHEWYFTQPSMTPPYFFDLLSCHDSNFRGHKFSQGTGADFEDSELDMEHST